MNSRSFQIFIALSIPIIVIISVLLLISLEKKTVNSTEGDFPYMLWASSPKNCIGNSYIASIEIDSQMALIEDGEKEGIVVLANINANPIPIFIPRSLEASVHPKQKFKALLFVNNNGSLEAKALNKF